MTLTRDRADPADRAAGPVSGAVVALVGSAGAAAVALGVPPLAPLVPWAYLGAPLALVLLWARSHPARAFELALWLWVLAPGVRRVVDLVTGYHENSVVLLAPPLVALLGGALALEARWRAAPTMPAVPAVDPRAARLVVRVVLLVGYAGAVALVLGRAPVALGLAGVQVLSPLALGLLALVLVGGEERTAVLDRFATGVALVVGGYGIVQFLLAPPWDAQWLRDVDQVAQSFGRPFPLQIRVFSTVNDPGSLAVVLVAAILWLVVRRRGGLVGQVALLSATACLGLTLVRSSWIALAVALAYVLLRGWLRPGRVLLAAVAVAALLALSGSVAAPVVERFTDSTSSGTSDESYRARTSFVSTQLLPALGAPFGDGLGSTGTAVRRDSGGDDRFANTDSGYVEALRTWGGPLGAVLLASILAAAAALSRRVRPGARGAAAFLVTVPVQLAFSGVWTGTAGVMFWVSVAALAADGTGAGQPRRGRRRASSPDTSETRGTTSSRTVTPEVRVNSAAAATASRV